MKVSADGSYGALSQESYEKLQSFYVPTAWKCIKLNFLLAGRVLVSPPLIVVHTTQAAFIFE